MIVQMTSTNSQPKIEFLLDECRNSLGKYCMEACKAKCCKKGKLLIPTYEEISLICKPASKTVMNNMIVKRDDGRYELLLDKGTCPSLDSKNMCTIYTQWFRPGICADFPVFLRGQKVFVAEFCPATKEKSFEKFIKAFENEGFEVFKQ